MVLIDKNVVPNPPSMLWKHQEEIRKHQEQLKAFFDGYTQEILTRKDFRLLNNVFNPNVITEKELDDMEVVGDGFEHMDIFQHGDNSSESNTFFEPEDNSKLIEEAKTSESMKKSKTKVPKTLTAKNESLFSNGR